MQGGSAYHIVARNTFNNCGTTGFGAGQGTAFQYMVPPWLQYEVGKASRAMYCITLSLQPSRFSGGL